MKKKGIFFILLFSTLIVVNLFLILKINYLNKKDVQIKKILTEISRTNPNEQFNSPSGPAILGSFQTEATLSDNRVANLKSFFRKYNSPLFDYAEIMVSYSDQNHFDYRLLPAIAMQESNLCQHIPENSFNCWGWGIYGDSVIKFSSYEEAIETVAKGLKEHYLDKGLITASAIMQKYTPSSGGSWQNGVNIFLRMLE